MKCGRVVHRQLTFEAMAEIAEKIEADREAWRKALGVCQGFDMPDAPIPATQAEIEAEIAITTERENTAYRVRLSLPPGTEREAQGLAMVQYRSRRWRLTAALKDGVVASKRSKKGT